MHVNGFLPLNMQLRKFVDLIGGMCYQIIGVVSV